MKIELEIDDKYKDTNLHIIWGMVPIARYLWTKQYWELKTGFCSDCGKCCKRMTEKKRFPFVGKDGCIYHTHNCSLSYFRPVGCSLAGSPIEDCTVKWERIE